MSTRSTITIEPEDGSIRSIYCHFDGYIDHNGRILLEHYKTPAQVNALIDLGNISVLGEKVAPSALSLHAFGRPEAGVTVAYHRDRGEDLHITYLESLSDIDCEEFNYLFRDNTWYVWRNTDIGDIVTIAQALSPDLYLDFDNKATEDYRKRFIKTCKDHNEFVADADGFVYWQPEGTTSGYLASHHLRWLADELDKRNKDWQKKIDEHFAAKA
jgi:hypothetical protein